MCNNDLRSCPTELHWAFDMYQDPATGSVHCTLGPYWAAKLGKAELKGFQVGSNALTY